MKVWLFVLLFGLAGCLGPLDADGADDAQAGPGEGTGADREGVVFHTGPYEAFPGSPAVYEVEVPEGAVNVRFEISTVSLLQTSRGVVKLEGCGQEDVDWSSPGNIVVVVGFSGTEGDLCERPESGMQTLSIETDLTPLQGTFTIRADVPSSP